MGHQNSNNVLALLIFLVSLSGCSQDTLKPISSTPEASTPQTSNAADNHAEIQWQSPLLQNHPMTGKVFSTASRSLLSEKELLQQLTQSQYLLIGEKHDNPDHHQIQQRLLSQLLQRKNTRIVFEMLDNEQNTALDKLTASDNLAQIKSKLNWSDSGWSWSDYGPLIQSAAQQQSEIRSGNIARPQLQEIYRNGPASIVTSDRFRSFSSVTQEVRNTIQQQVYESHCKTMPLEHMTPMVNIQIARDASMASAMTNELSGEQYAILVAGNFHSRKDLGVPLHLNALSSASKTPDTTTLLLLEVEAGMTELGDYAYADNRVADYVWFTPKFTEKDYCAGLRSTEKS
ncbi:ChaN family lipoprotein [Amphritea sp. HPY]|uniref:ChaN family lipoprotein n=1 Tax=Amphritea sp. HPY TaxID=3421652 RepID=UPI003D7E6D54